MNKYSKGQVSIFVVVATIFVVAMIILFVASYDRIEIFNADKSSFKVKENVESCMLTLTNDGIEEIAKRGGWLYHGPMLFTDRSKTEYENRIATGLDVLEKLEIPYWFYYDDGAEAFKTNIPELDSDNPYSIRMQLERYIQLNFFDECFRNSDVYEDIYEIEFDENEFDIEVDFRGDDIFVQIGSPIVITEIATQGIETVSTFRTESFNRILIPYYLAQDIVNAEIESSFVEKRMLQFLNPYQSTAERDLLPPFYEYKLSYDFRPWKIPEVKNLALNIISSSIGEIKFIGTDYEETTLEPELRDNEFAVGLTRAYTKDYLTEHSVIKESNPQIFEDYENYRVTPTYNTFFPTYFSIDPSFGNIIHLPKPQAFINFLPFFFTEYVAVYEITAPMMFVIESNEGLEFNLAIETNIDHNTPLAENYELSFDLEELDLGDQSKSLICDPPQMISEFVSINLTDPIYGGRTEVGLRDGVDGAIVTFTCKDIASCYIGESEINGVDRDSNISQMRFRLPIDCNPGTLEIYKYGHQRISFDNLDPKVDEEINLGEVFMPSAKKLKVNFGIKDSEKGPFSQGRKLNDKETGFMTFQNLETPEFVSVIELNETSQYELEMELLPGNYTITGFVIYNEEILIPSEEYCYNDGLFSEKCETLEELPLSAWQSAGLQIDRFDISTKKLLNSETINVNLVDYGIPSSYDDLNTFGQKVSDLSLASGNLLPTFEFIDN